MGIVVLGLAVDSKLSSASPSQPVAKDADTEMRYPRLAPAQMLRLASRGGYVRRLARDRGPRKRLGYKTPEECCAAAG